MSNIYAIDVYGFPRPIIVHAVFRNRASKAEFARYIMHLGAELAILWRFMTIEVAVPRSCGK
jgi:hypothetical protein